MPGPSHATCVRACLYSDATAASASAAGGAAAAKDGAVQESVQAMCADCKALPEFAKRCSALDFLPEALKELAASRVVLQYCYVFLHFLPAGAFLGVVGAGFDPVSGDAAQNSPQGWMLDADDGCLAHFGRISGWEGQPEEDELKEGDVVVRLPLPCSTPLRSRCARSVRRRACCSTSTRQP